MNNKTQDIKEYFLETGDNDVFNIKAEDFCVSEDFGNIEFIISHSPVASFNDWLYFYNPQYVQYIGNAYCERECDE